jgi:hypothetical protein
MSCGPTTMTLYMKFSVFFLNPKLYTTAHIIWHRDDYAETTSYAYESVVGMCSGLARLMVAIWFSGGVRAVSPGGWDPRKREGRREVPRRTTRQRHARKTQRTGEIDARNKERVSSTRQDLGLERVAGAVAQIGVRGLGFEGKFEREGEEREEGIAPNRR